jgi:hypothetical protein
MSSTQRFHLQIAPVALAVFGLAAAGWYLAPERLLTWMVAAAAMALFWLVFALIQRIQKTDAQRRMLAGSVMLGGAILALPLMVNIARSMGYVLGDEGSRVQNIVAGFLFAAFGNAVPKVVAPITAKGCSPTAVQALQRFCGWTFVIAGLGFALAWAVLPLSIVAPVAISIVAGAMLLAAVRTVWARTQA